MQAALIEHLGRIPLVRSIAPRDVHSTSSAAYAPDGELEIALPRATWTVAFECKASGQPATVRSAAAQLRQYVSGIPSRRTYPVVVAPFLSDRSADICRAAGVGYVDLAGNCELFFDSVYVKVRGAENPFRAKRELRSLFTPRARRVLEALLTPPVRAWKVTELVKASGVSLGHVSNVRRRLIELEWAEVVENGLVLRRPEAVFEAWEEALAGRPPPRTEFYTPLHGGRLEEAARAAVREAGDGREALLASFSAAQWLAPFVRQGSTYFLASANGLERLRERLQLRSAPTGGNVGVTIATDAHAFESRLEPTPGIWCTGLVRTWADLAAAGERGREAARHLLDHAWRPQWGRPT